MRERENVWGWKEKTRDLQELVELKTKNVRRERRNDITRKMF